MPSGPVDFGGVAEGTLEIGRDATISVSWPGEIGPGQWFRLAPQLNAENSRGTSVLIIEEGISIDQNGTHLAWLHVRNNGVSPATWAVNVLSAPSHQ